jgi:hypothetical protein
VDSANHIKFQIADYNNTIVAEEIVYLHEIPKDRFVTRNIPLTNLTEKSIYDYKSSLLSVKVSFFLKMEQEQQIRSGV